MNTMQVINFNLGISYYVCKRKDFNQEIKELKNPPICFN